MPRILTIYIYFKGLSSFKPQFWAQERANGGKGQGRPSTQGYFYVTI